MKTSKDIVQQLLTELNQFEKEQGNSESARMMRELRVIREGKKLEPLHQEFQRWLVMVPQVLINATLQDDADRWQRVMGNVLITPDISLSTYISHAKTLLQTMLGRLTQLDMGYKKEILNDSLESNRPYVLVVDDSDKARQWIVDILHILGCEVKEASTNTQAVDLLLDMEFSLVITDAFRRPERAGERGYVGLDLVRIINDRFSKIPIILISRDSPTLLQKKAPNLHVHGLLNKTLSEREVMAAIQKVLDGGMVTNPWSGEGWRSNDTTKIKVLFLGTNPITTLRLKLDEEVKKIQMNLKLAKERDNIELRQEWAVTVDTLIQAILDESPDIVHFSGHGQQEGIILQDEIGEPKTINAKALADLFKLFKDSVQCIVLNSCYSEVQAKAIKLHIPYVIGMKAGISDKASIAFSTGFYKAIGAGRDIPFAFELGITAIKLEGVSDDDIPVLL